MSEELLKVQNLKKFFQTPGGSLHAVDDVSFSINEASTLGVVVNQDVENPHWGAQSCV
mgnify:CR=1 FL=1